MIKTGKGFYWDMKAILNKALVRYVTRYVTNGRLFARMKFATNGNISLAKILLHIYVVANLRRSGIVAILVN